MELLFIFFAFIAALIIIAKLASKTRPESERLQSGVALEETVLKEAKPDDEKDPADPGESQLLDALIILLIRKKLISEKELQSVFDGDMMRSIREKT